MGLYSGFELENVNLEGFQLVKGTYFTKQSEPQMTLFETAIAFNGAAYEALNNCDQIQVLVNDRNHQILIRSAVSKDEQVISWKGNCKSSKYNRIECTSFARHIIDTWGLEKGCRYRATGKMCLNDQKLMIMFDFDKSEKWVGKTLVKDNG